MAPVRFAAEYGAKYPKAVTTLEKDADALLTPAQKEREASPTIPSWNQLVAWLRELDLLRRVEAA